MITAVSTTPAEVLSAEGSADATVIVLFARSTKKGDAMGVTLTRTESMLLIMQLQEHLDATEQEPGHGG